MKSVSELKERFCYPEDYENLGISSFVVNYINEEIYNRLFSHHTKTEKELREIKNRKCEDCKYVNFMKEFKTPYMCAHEDGICVGVPEDFYCKYWEQKTA